METKWGQDDARWLKMAHDGPKLPKIAPQNDSKWPPDGPNVAQVVPRGRQDGGKMDQDSPKTAHDGAKMEPR